MCVLISIPLSNKPTVIIYSSDHDEIRNYLLAWYFLGQLLLEGLGHYLPDRPVGVKGVLLEPTEQGQDLRLTFPVPSSVQDAELVDVKISASNWVVKRVLRKSSLVAWKLRRVGFTDG